MIYCMSRIRFITPYAYSFSKITWYIISESNVIIFYSYNDYYHQEYIYVCRILTLAVYNIFKSSMSQLMMYHIIVNNVSTCLLNVRVTILNNTYIRSYPFSVQNNYLILLRHNSLPI